MVEYRVYVRFEDTPAIARKNSEQKPDPEYGPLTLEAVSGADPGEETPMLHEALETTRENGKFIALYRGKHAGYNRRGAELFTPIGLAWCKDNYELGQMLGADPAPHEGGSGTDFGSSSADSMGSLGTADVRSSKAEMPSYNHEPETIPQEHTRPSERVNSSGAAAPSDNVSSRGWLVWTGIIAGSFIASFVVVYGLAKLFG